MEITYDRLPDYMRSGARLYIEQGIKPGDFMTAVLRDQFHEAIVRADHINKVRLRDWADWLHWDIPMAAHGSVEEVNTWMEHKGLEGWDEADPDI